MFFFCLGLYIDAHLGSFFFFFFLVYSSVTCNTSDVKHWSLVNCKGIMHVATFICSYVEEHPFPDLYLWIFSVKVFLDLHGRNHVTLPSPWFGIRPSFCPEPGFTYIHLMALFLLSFLPPFLSQSPCAIKFKITSIMHNHRGAGGTWCMVVQYSQCILCLCVCRKQSPFLMNYVWLSGD